MLTASYLCQWGGECMSRPRRRTPGRVSPDKLEPQTAELEGYAVLCVDPDPLACERMVSVLREQGTPAQVAHSADVALERLAHGNHALVVAHLDGPDADCINLIQRARDAGHSASFLLITDRAGEDLPLEGVPDDAVVGVLTNPWAPAELRELVHRSLRVDADRQQLIARDSGSFAIVELRDCVALIEDDPADQVTACRHLENRDFACVTFGRLTDALAALSQRDFAAAVVDLNLPDARGMDVIRRLYAARPDLPVVVLTGVADQALASQVLEMGAQEYVAKDSLTADTLADSVERAVRRKRAERRLAYLAYHDSLTGLSNERHLWDRLDQALERCARRDTECGLLFVDLDGFKQVNDSLGHAAGDRVLQMAAERMSQCLRSYDTLARLGGDEFAVLLEDCNTTELGNAAHRVIEVLRAPMDVAGSRVQVSASVGAALYPSCGRTPGRLLEAADEAMYRAKRAGKNRVAAAPARDAGTPNVPQRRAAENTNGAAAPALRPQTAPPSVHQHFERFLHHISHDLGAPCGTSRAFPSCCATTWVVT